MTFLYINLCPATQLYSLITFRSFFIDSLAFSMSSENKDSFISFFQICIHFISFSCLVALARTSSMILKMGGERVHPCLVPDLNGKALSFLT